MNKTFKWRELGAGLIVPIVLIAVWQTACSLGWVNEHVLPSPWAVVTRWVADKKAWVIVSKPGGAPL